MSINASFAVHNNMRSHKGAMLTFGKGAVFFLLNKQKVNSTSSTVAEIIGMDDKMNLVMWVKLFIETQVSGRLTDAVIKKLGAQPSVLQHDNTSSIRLKVNGKRFSIK